MKLNKEEESVMNTFTTEQMRMIEKFFIRAFEHLPSEYRSIPNDQLGEQVKAHLTARDINTGYMTQFKNARQKDGEGKTPVAPE